MRNKLNEIIENKAREIAQKKKKRGRDFLDAIKNPTVGDISIIAEIKLASPSEGKLGKQREIGKRAILYEKGLADAISVVVDNKYFGGKLEFIKKIKEVVTLPILAKDFVIDRYQIYEIKAYGADAVLLIAKIISRDKLKQYISLCFDIGLEPVVEVQNEKELDMAIGTDTRLIAVNARDLISFNVDIKEACRLICLIPKKFVSLGFSGVLGRREVEKYRQAGVKGVLVGTNLMKSKDIKGSIRKLKGL